jgi:phosphoglycerate dehydrogenase-like enzyme
MKGTPLVAVTSRSFSNNIYLRQQLQNRFSHVRFNEKGVKLTGDALVQFLHGAQGAIIGLEVIDDVLLEKTPDLSVICKVGTGIDKIDLDALVRRRIKFLATPGVNKRSVSELVLGLMLTVQRHLSATYSLLKQGTWQQRPGQLISNKVIGIIGFGAIGQDLAMLLRAFDCRCLVYDVQPCKITMPHVEQVSLDTLLAVSDIISLHIPLLIENYHFLGKDRFSKMKKGVVVINTARGGLIDEGALFTALQSRHVSAAALDVFEHEPHVPEQLLGLDNFFATSHIAGSTSEAIEAMGMAAMAQLEKLMIEKEVERYGYEAVTSG